MRLNARMALVAILLAGTATICVAGDSARKLFIEASTTALDGQAVVAPEIAETIKDMNWSNAAIMVPAAAEIGSG
jgi:hypothetical protein